MKNMRILMVSILALLIFMPVFGEGDVTSYLYKWRVITKAPMEDPITVFIGNDPFELHIAFEKITGTAEVQIVDAKGYLIYKDEVNTDLSPSLVIPLEDYAPGEYQLLVSEKDAYDAVVVFKVD